MKAQDSLNISVSHYFGLARMPFSDDLKSNELFGLPALQDVARSVEFAVTNNLYFAIIGEIGSGKSSALRYACDRLGSKSVVVLPVIGASWGFVEMLRQFLAIFSIEFKSFMPSLMVNLIQDRLRMFSDEGKKIVLTIDEAHLLRSDIFSQLHVLTQDATKGSQLASIVLCGQDGLADKLAQKAAQPLASRITDGYFMQPLTEDVYEDYFNHHLALAKAPNDMFDEMARAAIWQASSRNLRSIGILCRKCLQEAVNRGQNTVTAAIVRDVSLSWWNNQNLVPKKS